MDLGKEEGYRAARVTRVQHLTLFLLTFTMVVHSRSWRTENFIITCRIFFFHTQQWRLTMMNPVKQRHTRRLPNSKVENNYYPSFGWNRVQAQLLSCFPWPCVFSLEYILWNEKTMKQTTSTSISRTKFNKHHSISNNNARGIEMESYLEKELTRSKLRRGNESAPSLVSISIAFPHAFCYSSNLDVMNRAKLFEFLSDKFWKQNFDSVLFFSAIFVNFTVNRGSPPNSWMKCWMNLCEVERDPWISWSESNL